MADGRTITIGGKTYLVTADMADALEAQEKEWKSKLDEPAPKQDPTPPRATVEPLADKSIAERIFTDPDHVLNEFGEKLMGRVLSEYEKREQERQQRVSAEQETRRFWDDFVSRNADLKSDMSLARTVLADEQHQFQRFMGKNDDASKNECIDLLADLTRKRIQAYIARTKESSGTEAQQNHPFVEGAVLKFEKAPPGKTDDDKPSSLSDIIKARAEARRKGKTA